MNKITRTSPNRIQILIVKINNKLLKTYQIVPFSIIKIFPKIRKMYIKFQNNLPILIEALDHTVSHNNIYTNNLIIHYTKIGNNY